MNDDDGGTDRGAVWILFLQDTCCQDLVSDFTSEIVCVGDSTVFTDLTTGSVNYWKWYFGDGDSVVGIQNPAHLYSTADTFMAMLIVSDNDTTPCFDTIVKPVIVLDTLKVYTPVDDTICLGDSINLGPLNLVCRKFPYSYSWSPGTGLNDPNIANPQASPTLTTKYYITVTDSLGVITKDSIEIYVDSSCCVSHALAEPSDSLYCLGDTVYIINNSIAQPGATYAWDFGPGATPGSYIGATPPPIIYSSPGAFTVRLILADVCGVDTGYMTVNIFPPPLINAGNDTLICIPDTIQLGTAPVSTYSYSWFPPTGLSDPSIANPIVILNSSIIYYLTVTDNVSGCKAYDSIRITNDTIPITNLGSDVIICKGNAASISAFYPGATYLWSDSSNNAILNTTDSGTYWVIVSNICESSSDTITVSVEDCRCTYFTPNTFSPNNDGINDQLEVKGNFSSLKLMIYDRWGTKVYETRNINRSWDGRFKNELLKPQVFVYHLKIICNDDQLLEDKGTITLIK